MSIDSVLVDSEPFAVGASVQYTFPADATYQVTFAVVGGNARLDYNCVEPAAEPIQLLEALQELVAEIDAQSDIPDGFAAKVDAALASLELGATEDACGSLGAFLNQVSALEGKKLTVEEANELTAAATEIRELLSCQ